MATNYDDRYVQSSKSVKPLLADGHEFVSQGCGLYRCIVCDTRTFYLGQSVPRCSGKNKEQHHDSVHSLRAG